MTFAASAGCITATPATAAAMAAARATNPHPLKGALTMASQRAKTPHPSHVAVTLTPYSPVTGFGDITPHVIHDVAERYGRATVARLTVAGPNGEKASGFLTLHWDGRAWRIEVDHDATDYNTDTSTHRRAGVALRFFANGRDDA